MGAPTSETVEGVHNYTRAEEVPQHIQKYWHQRNKIFSKYDEGIWLTDDSWFSVTPEPVANKIAQHVATVPENKKTILIDAFAGAGGNAIAFARSERWAQVYAVEKDPKVLACGKHNAEIYGVSDKIEWIEGDIFDVLQDELCSVAADAVIFGSPPWGGPNYTNFEVFDLREMQPYPIFKLWKSFSAATDDFVLYLPRNSDLNQVASYARTGEKLDVIHYCMYGASKALCVYVGKFNLG